MNEQPHRASVRTWMASRQVIADDGRTFEVSMSAPEPVTSDDDDDPMWTCIVRFVVDGVEHLKECPGVDAFGAVTLALASIERLLSAREEFAPWLPPASDHGFARVVFLDPEMMDVPRVLRRIDEELERESDATMWRKHVAKQEGTYKPTPSMAKFYAVRDGLFALCAYAVDGAPYDDAVMARFEAAETRGKVRAALARIRAEADDGERRKLAEALMRERKWLSARTHHE